MRIKCVNCIYLYRINITRMAEAEWILHILDAEKNKRERERRVEGEKEKCAFGISRYVTVLFHFYWRDYIRSLRKEFAFLSFGRFLNGQ